MEELYKVVDFTQPKLITICGYVSSGKTTLAMNIANDYANKYIGVLVISYEEPKKYLYEDYYLSKNNLYIDEPLVPQLTLEDIEEICINMKEKVKLIVIQSFDRIANHKLNDRPYLLKKLIKELNIPIIVTKYPMFGPNSSKPIVFVNEIEPQSLVESSDVLITLNKQYFGQVFRDRDIKNMELKIYSKDNVEIVNVKPKIKLLDLRYRGEYMNEIFYDKKKFFVELCDKIKLGEKNLITIGESSKIGKTTLVLDFVAFMAINKKIPVLMFSSEISKEVISKRIICSESKIKYEKMHFRTLDTEDRRKIDETAKRLSSLPLWIDDKPSISIDYIIKESKNIKYKEEYKKKYGENIGLIIIDEIQLLDYDEDKKEEIPYLLKKLSKELEVPVIVTSQLSEDVEKRKDKIPILEDFNYKSLVENSDVVMFLDGENIYSNLNLTISKNENGTLETIEL